MKKINYFLAAAIVILLASCGSTKNVAYLQNSSIVDLSKSAHLYDAHIMPKDILTITVNTVNPEASAPFNLYLSLKASAPVGLCRPIWCTTTVASSFPC